MAFKRLCDGTLGGVLLAELQELRNPPKEIPNGELKGFAVAGADGKWHWAKAEISGKDLLAGAAEVPEPVAVRYAYRSCPLGDCNLYNRDGLPASPFRSDDW